MLINAYPEIHMYGIIEIQSDDVTVVTKRVDIGIQISSDGRIWICVDGKAFLRFKPTDEKGRDK